VIGEAIFDAPVPTNRLEGVASYGGHLIVVDQGGTGRAEESLTILSADDMCEDQAEVVGMFVMSQIAEEVGMHRAASEFRRSSGSTVSAACRL